MTKQKRKEESLRQLLAQAGAESPGREFTTRIIKAIEAEEAAQAAGKHAVSSYLLETASPGFEASVLTKIKATKRVKPIIPLAVWYGYAALVVLSLLVGFQSTGRPVALLIHVLNLIPLPGASTQDLLKILALALISSAGLITLDHLLRQKSVTINRLTRPD